MSENTSNSITYRYLPIPYVVFAVPRTRGNVKASQIIFGETFVMILEQRNLKTIVPN